MGCKRDLGYDMSCDESVHTFKLKLPTSGPIQVIGVIDQKTMDDHTA